MKNFALGVITALSATNIRRLLIGIFAICLVVALCDMAARPDASSAVRVEVTYLGNEGVLLAAEGKQVAIDALHREYPEAPFYAHLAGEQLTRLENAQPPFNNIDLVLFTHMHSDHFHLQSAGSYLEHNPSAVMIAPPNAVDQLRDKYAGFEKLKDRVIALSLQPGQRKQMNKAGLDLTVLGLPHEGRPGFDHLGYLVTVGGKRFLHVGDAELAAGTLRQLHLADEGIDVAFIPYWILETPEGRDVVRSQIRPKHLVAIHVPPGEIQRVTKELQGVLPGARILATLLQTDSY